MNEGMNNLVGFMGVVEDNRDPMKLGRVRVRAFGFHSDDKTEIPTDALPWANIINGGYGGAYKPPAIGSWVFGFFMDGADAQHPLLIGTLASMPTQFMKDTSGINFDGTDPCNLYQPTMPRLARAESLEETSVLVKNVLGGQDVETADGVNWKTPTSPYNTEYPHNAVYESSSGHVMEFDDTPGNERINIYHKSGSYIEIDAYGNTIHNSRGASTTVIERNGNVLVRGDCNITVEGNATIKSGGDLAMVVDGDMTHTVHGSYTLNIANRFDVNVGQAIRGQAGRMIFETTTDFIDLKSAGEIRVNSEGNMSLLSGAEMYLDGSKIDLADGKAIAADSTELGAPVQPKTKTRKPKITRNPLSVTDIDDGDTIA
jgi:lipopolysaccharide export system protein LptA